MSNPMMSIFPNVKLHATGSKSFAEIMDDIRKGKFAAKVEEIRAIIRAFTGGALFDHY